MESGEELRQRMGTRFSQLAAGEPSDFRSAYITVPQSERPLLTGTSVPAIVPMWRTTASGILVPANLATPQPLDLCLVYLTADELFGFSPPVDYVFSQLRRLPADSVLYFVAQVMNDIKMPGASRREVDQKYVTAWFKGETRSRAENILRNPERSLLVPQALLMLAKLALVYSGDALVPSVPPGNPVAALMTLTQYLGRRTEEGAQTVIGDSPGPLGREMIANQYFNHAGDAAALMARFTRRWHQIPKERNGEPKICDLAAAYKEATGVSLTDVIVVGSALWASACNGNPHVGSQYLSTLGWDEARLEAALGLISSDIPGLRDALGGEPEDRRSEWSFDMFRQWPVIRLYDNSLLVIDQSLLVERMFGWLPFFDIKFPPGESSTAEQKKLSKKAEQCLRHVTEIYVSEVLHSIADGGAARRVYDDQQLQQAFRRKGRKIADAAIDYGDSWVVVEVTTTQLKRESVTAISEQAQIDDLDKLVGEVEQIDATIRSIREEEAQLTGIEMGIRKMFIPLLVMAEGFPVSPITLTVLRERVKSKGLLAGRDVKPLEIVDVEDLEIVEALQEEGGPSLKAILEMKQTAGLSRSALRDYIMVEMGRAPSRSRRIQALWEQAVQPAIEAVAPASRAGHTACQQ